MKSYKQLLNEWAQHTDVLHAMTPEEMVSLRKALLEMYKDIARVCSENGLTVMLGGGSCLGAIRHQGFIPWDDDLDLNMARPDYNKFIKLLEQGALGEKYEFAYPNGKIHNSSAFLKIYKKNTKLVSFGSENAKYPLGIFIDIFPLEGVSSSCFVRLLKGTIANGMRLIANCVTEVGMKSKSVSEAEKSYPELKAMARKRSLIGHLFSFTSYRKWTFWYDRFVANEDMTGLVGAPTGRKLYNGEIHDHSVFFPVAKATFEGIEVNVPGKTEEYLICLYGRNYMQLPPIEKRESHFVVEFKL